MASLTAPEIVVDSIEPRNKRSRPQSSGNADVPVGSYVNADEDVGVPGTTRTPEQCGCNARLWRRL